MPHTNGVHVRLTVLEHAIERLQDRVEKTSEIREGVAVLHTEFKNLNARLDDLEESMENDVRGLKRLLIVFSLTVTGAAISFALTTIVGFGAPS